MQISTRETPLKSRFSNLQMTQMRLWRREGDFFLLIMIVITVQLLSNFQGQMSVVM